MHASWLLLTASGEIPAKIIHIQQPRFVTKDNPIIREIDLCSSEFPVVRFIDKAVKITDKNVEIATVESALGIVGDHPKMKNLLRWLQC